MEMHQNSRALRVTIVACGGVAAIAAISMWLMRAVPTPALPQQPRSVTQPSKAEAPAAPAKGPAVGSATNTSGAIDYKKAFTEAHNYWDYAHRVLPAAKAGNPDAQFYLSRVLERCRMKTTECTFNTEAKNWAG